MRALLFHALEDRARDFYPSFGFETSPTRGEPCAQRLRERDVPAVVGGDVLPQLPHPRSERLVGEQLHPQAQQVRVGQRCGVRRYLAGLLRLAGAPRRPARARGGVRPGASWPSWSDLDEPWPVLGPAGPGATTTSDTSLVLPVRYPAERVHRPVGISRPCVTVRDYGGLCWSGTPYPISVRR